MSKRQLLYSMNPFTSPGKNAYTDVMKKKIVAKRPIRATKPVHVKYSHRHFSEKDFILLLIGVVVLLFVAGGLVGLFPSIWDYPRVLGAMVGR